MKTKRFIYDKEDILAEYDKDDNLQAGYIHGAGIDNHLSVIQGENNYYYHEDAFGSTVLLTNESGIPVRHYAYDAYGRMKIYGATGLELSFDNTPVSNFYTYTGREYDNESSLYYHRARFYSPRTGRFLSEDPIGFSSGDFNFYRYVFNNPVNFVDPTGTTSGFVACKIDENMQNTASCYHIIDITKMFNVPPNRSAGNFPVSDLSGHSGQMFENNQIIFGYQDFERFKKGRQDQDSPEPCE